MAVTQSHFRFYADGTESGAVAHAAEDANPTAGLGKTIAFDTIFHLRFCLQCDGTQQQNIDAEFQYRKNGGTWTNLTTSTTDVRVTASANLTDGANTTQRLSGTGTFETSSAGVTEDGISGGTAFDIIASGNGETVCPLVLRSADLVNGDVLEFRLTRDGGVLIDTYAVTPTLTVVANMTRIVTTEDLHVSEIVILPVEALSREVTAETLHIDDYGEIQVLGRIRVIDTVVDRSLVSGGLERDVTAETLHIADVVTARMTLGDVTLAETLHIADPIENSRLAPLESVLAETLHISDPVTPLMGGITATLAETLHIADVVEPAMLGDLSRSVSETLHISEGGQIQVLGRIRSTDTIVDRSLEGGTVLTASLSETLHISDTVTARLSSLFAVLSEEIHAVDGVDSYVALSSIEAVHVIETTLIAELSGATNQSATLSETLHVSDAIAAALLTAGQLSATVAETLHVSDVVAARLNPLQAVLAETLHVADLTVFFGDTLFATVSETVFVLDGVDSYVAMSTIEAVHVLDTDLTVELSTPGQLTRSLTETLHISETLVRVELRPLFAILSETLHIADVVTPDGGNLSTGVLTETLHLSEGGQIQVLGRIRVIDTDLTVTRQDPGTLTATLSETLHIADAVESWASLDDPEVLHVTDTIIDVFLSAAGTLSTGTLTETLHISETLLASMGELVATVSETLHISDAVTASLTPLVVTLSETLHVSETVSVFENPLEAVVAETLHVTDTIVNRFLASAGSLDPVLLTETLHITDTVTVFANPLFAILSETLHIADSVTAQMTLGDVTRTETLHISDPVIARMTLGDVVLAETLHIADTLVRVELRPLFVAVSETLHVADVVTATMGDISIQAPTETLHISDVVTARMTLGDVTLSETLHVTDSVVVELPTLEAVVSETLHIEDVVTIYVAGTLLVDISETLHVVDTIYPERPPVIIGVGIYQFTMTGVGIYDPEA